jgi:hypothetical protein
MFRKLQAPAALVVVVLLAGLLPASAEAVAVETGPAAHQPVPRFGSSVSRYGNEDYPAAKRRISRHFGAPRVMRMFHPGLPSPWREIRRNLGTGAPLVVSFKARPSDILSGRHDAYLKRWFDTAPEKRRTFWSYYHEPEDNIARGEFSAGEYRAAWRHLTALSRRSDNPRLRPTLILMTWTLNPAAHRNWRNYYAKGSIKVLGWDGYNPYEAQGRYSRPSEMFGRAYRTAKAEGLAWGIAEFGSQLARGDAGAKRAAWLTRCARYLSKRHVRFVTYFDAAFDGENDFRLRDAPSKAAWRAVVSARRR